MEKKKAPPPVADINVTPMVDVMLVLLIIFMVITPMLTKGVSVDMVRTKNPDRHAGGRQGRRHSDRGHAQRRRVPEPRQHASSPPDQLPEKVRDLLTNKLDKTVYIKADARAKYRVVEDVVDNLRAAGVDQIGLITEADPRREQDPQRRPHAAASRSYRAATVNEDSN